MNPTAKLAFLLDWDRIATKEVIKPFTAPRAHFTYTDKGDLCVQTYNNRNESTEMLALKDRNVRVDKCWSEATDNKTYATTLVRGKYTFVKVIDRERTPFLTVRAADEVAIKIGNFVLKEGLRYCGCSDCHPDPALRFHPENHGFPENNVWPPSKLFEQVDFCVVENEQNNTAELLVLAPAGDGTFTVTSYSKLDSSNLSIESPLSRVLKNGITYSHRSLWSRWATLSRPEGL